MVELGAFLLVAELGDQELHERAELDQESGQSSKFLSLICG